MDAALLIVTFNVRYDNNNEPRGPWQQRKEAIRALIKALGPIDVLCLQEVRLARSVSLGRR